jgi:hypothetical protein
VTELSVAVEGTVRLITGLAIVALPVKQAELPLFTRGLGLLPASRTSRHTCSPVNIIYIAYKR